MGKTIKLILPLPPSDNERLIVMWQQRRFILSNKYRKYKDYIARNALVQKYNQKVYEMFKPTYENQLRMYMQFYLKDKRRDAVDMLKCLLDSMKDVIYKDDKWVIPLISYPHIIDSRDPRIELTIGYD